MENNNQIDDWQEVTSAPTSPMAAPEQTGAMMADDWEEVSLNKVDDLTGEDIPIQFSGVSPDTAMNKSIVSAADRFKLSLGNLQGNVEYLKTKFQDVKPVKEGSDELAVLKEGTWYRVDPSNGEIADPWEKAKEYALDLTADLGPVGIGIGATAAVGAAVAAPLAAVAAVSGGALTAGTVGAATIGSAAAGGALAATTRTSLGRVVGTYDATVGEQAWDIGFETMLNTVGAKIALGVKPTAAKIAPHLEKIAERFKDVVDDYTPGMVKTGASAVANSPKALFKKLFASFSVGEDNFDTMVKNHKSVSLLMKETHAKVGGDTKRYHDSITMNQIETVKNVAQNGRAILSQIYGKMRNDILGSVDGSFSANFDDAINNTYLDAIKNGIGKISVKTTRSVAGQKDWVTGLTKEAVEEGTQVLTGAQAAEYVAKNGLKGAKFSLLSQQEMANAIKQGAKLGDELGYLASDADAYKVIAGYFDDLGLFHGSAKRTGREAAEALLDFKKLATDKSYSLANMEKVRDLPGIKRILDNSRGSIDNSIRDGLKRAGIANQFDKLNSTYSELSSSFSPMLNANYQFATSKDPKVYETLLGQFLSRPGKQVTKREAIDAAIAAAEEHGLSGLSKKMAKDKLQIQIGETAKAFNPLKQEGFKDGRVRAGMGLFAAQAAMNGQPQLAAALAGAAVMTSPQFAKTGVALTQCLSKGQQYMMSLTPKQLDQFFSNPQAINTFTNAIIQTPFARAQAEELLTNQIKGVAEQ